MSETLTLASSEKKKNTFLFAIASTISDTWTATAFGPRLGKSRLYWANDDDDDDEGPQI